MLPPPNIVFILADDLGYGDLGCYGQSRIHTPAIDRLAAQGMRFTQFYAGDTVCAPSRNTLMTGQHTGHSLFRGNAKISLGPADVTVAKLLKDQGYATGLSGKWGLGGEHSPGTPNRMGFEHFFGYVDQTHAHNYYPEFLVRDEERVPLRNIVPRQGPYGQGVASQKKDYTAALIGADAVEFIHTHRQRPFFLYFAPTLPHANNEAGRQGMEIPDYGAYAREHWPEPQKGLAAMITLLDTQVAAIMAELTADGLDRNTIVFFTSDNGPHAEGGNDPAFFKSAGPLRGIKRDMYEGGIREPFIARWPGRVPAGAVSGQVGYFPDVLPTLAALAGAKTPAAADGVSLLPTLIQTGRQEQHPYLYWEYYEGERSAQAVRMGNWKAIRKPILTGAIELYNLETDLGERHNLAGQQPKIVAQIQQIMEQAHGPTQFK